MRSALPVWSTRGRPQLTPARGAVAAFTPLLSLLRPLFSPLSLSLFRLLHLVFSVFLRPFRWLPQAGSRRPLDVAREPSGRSRARSLAPLSLIGYARARQHELARREGSRAAPRRAGPGAGAEDASMPGGKRGLVAPQNPFLENIVRRSSGESASPFRKTRGVYARRMSNSKLLARGKTRHLSRGTDPPAARSTLSVAWQVVKSQRWIFFALCWHFPIPLASSSWALLKTRLWRRHPARFSGFSVQFESEETFTGRERRSVARRQAPLRNFKHRSATPVRLCGCWIHRARRSNPGP